LRLGLRSRLFVVSLGLIAVVGGATGLFLEGRLRQVITEGTEQQLRRQASLAREALTALRDSEEIEQLDAVADRLGKAGGTRVTVIAADGHVLGDSELTPDQITTVELHHRRPEVVDAIAHGTGVSTRYSTTLETDMLYVATARADGLGAVRVATPLSAVEQAVRQLRLALLLAAGLGLLVAVLMSALASHLTTRPLLSLVDRARKLVEQDQPVQPPSDELGYVAGSLDWLARELDESVSSLARARDRLDAVLSSMGEGVIALEDDLRVRLVNPAARTLLDVDDGGELRGRMLVELSRTPDMVELARRAREANIEGELSLHNGERTVAVSGTPLRATGGSLLVLRDVTEVRRLETIRRDFVANISHELRTPVAVIRANSETLLNGALEDPEQGRRFAEASLRHAERLSNLLSDLLDLAKLEADAYRMDLAPLSLEQGLSAALAAVRPLADKRSISLELGATEVETVLADPQALEQILVNLLENAVKYAGEGGHVMLRAVSESGHARIEIADDGPGVDREHRDRIFERFYRVDAGRSREVGGTGLGLSIVKHLVGVMHGEVGMVPVQPHGSCFWFTLRTTAASASG